MSHVKYYSVEEAAQVAGVTTDVARSWVASRELVAVNVASARDAKKPRWRISEIELAAFLERRSTKPARPRTRRPKLKSVNEDFVEYV